MLEFECNCKHEKLDCHDVCGGPGIVDACGVCDGPGIPWEDRWVMYEGKQVR